MATAPSRFRKKAIPRAWGSEVRYEIKRDIKLTPVEGGVALYLDGVPQGIFPSSAEAMTLAMSLSAATIRVLSDSEAKRAENADRRRAYRARNPLRPRPQKVAPPPRKPAPVSRIDRNVLQEMFEAGQTLQAIGDRFGVSRERIRQIAEKMRLERPFQSVALRAPGVLSAWSDRNGSARPEKIEYDQRVKAWWQCLQVPHHRYRTTIENQRRIGCPFCAGRKTHVLDARPDLMTEYHPTRNPPDLIDKLSPKSTTLVWWICAAGHEVQTQFVSRFKFRKGTCQLCYFEMRRWQSTEDAAQFYNEGGFRCEDTSSDHTLEDVLQGVVTRIETALQA